MAGNIVKECLQTAWDHGINTFDTAEVGGTFISYIPEFFQLNTFHDRSTRVVKAKLRWVLPFKSLLGWFLYGFLALQ